MGLRLTIARRERLVSDETMSEEAIIERTCTGRCGSVLHYLLKAPGESGARVLTCLDGVTAYKDGHLCVRCDAAVEEVLAHRQEQVHRMASAKARGARQARVRARTRGRR